MNTSGNNSEGQKIEVVKQVAELSRLLGMMPLDDTVILQEPLTHNKMPISDWLRTTRNSFLKLSVLISKELDIQLQ